MPPACLFVYLESFTIYVEQFSGESLTDRPIHRLSDDHVSTPSCRAPSVDLDPLSGVPAFKFSLEALVDCSAIGDNLNTRHGW